MSGLAFKVMDVGIIPLLVLGVGWFAKKYIMPLLKSEMKKSVAKYVLLIADEITDWLVMKYPKKKWPEWLNEAVDKLIEVTGVNNDVAERAIRASISRKKLA